MAETKRVRLSARLSPTEYAALKSEAQRYHMSITGYLRLIIIKKPNLLN